MCVGNNANMKNYAGISVVVCILLCLTLIYTFPLYRESSDINPFKTSTNHNHYCEDFENYKNDTKLNLRKIPSALRNIKNINHLTRKYRQNATESKSDIDKNDMINSDLREYEQLVIMKKYPYLDIKELEMKYTPSIKSLRHSLSFASGFDIEKDSDISEQEEILNVEISNRGLSGFSIPSHTLKKSQDNKANLRTNPIIQPDVNRIKTHDEKILELLKNDISTYLESKNI